MQWTRTNQKMYQRKGKKKANMYSIRCALVSEIDRSPHVVDYNDVVIAEVKWVEFIIFVRIDHSSQIH